MRHRLVVGDDADGEGVGAALARGDLAGELPCAVCPLADDGHAHDLALDEVVTAVGRPVIELDGHVARYLMGVRFDPADLRAVVDEAARGHIGTISDRLALLCAHLDPRAGVHSDAVLLATRGVGLATLAALALFAWRRRRP